jgi:predicted nucleic acid-binding protein
LIFLDTGFLFALFSEDDEHHPTVQEVMARHRTRRLAEFVITTNLVVGEAITLFRTKGHPDPEVRHERAVTIGRRLWDGHFGGIYRVAEEDERAAFDYFANHRDKAYSFVDCVSFVVMERHGITEAFSVDSDFMHRFTAIPGPIR